MKTQTHPIIWEKNKEDDDSIAKCNGVIIGFTGNTDSGLASRYPYYYGLTVGVNMTDNNSGFCTSIEEGKAAAEKAFQDFIQKVTKRRLLKYKEKICKPENCKYQDNEADGIVFCGKCGK